GGVRGTVAGRTGGTVEDAGGTVTNEGTNVLLSAKASGGGKYVFSNFLGGFYTVIVEKDGFKKTVSRGVQVESNQIVYSTAVLELGDVSAVVQVEAGADLVKTDTSTLDATFTGKAVQDVPINTLGGDVKEFSVLAPGTTTQQGGVLGSGGSIG